MRESDDDDAVKILRKRLGVDPKILIAVEFGDLCEIIRIAAEATTIIRVQVSEEDADVLAKRLSSAIEKIG